MEMLIILATIGYGLQILGNNAWKFYTKRNMPGVHHAIYESKDFDRAVEQIKTGFKV